jgi:hypothetical protein
MLQRVQSLKRFSQLKILIGKGNDSLFRNCSTTSDSAYLTHGLINSYQTCFFFCTIT